jgi:Lipoprotein confined to pathogenic Mycobacterium
MAAPAVVVAILALAGCGTTGGGMTPEQQLRTRPGFEQATTGYVQMLTQMRTALQAITPTLQWDHPTPVIDDGALCGDPFTGIKGAETIFYSSDATGRVPEAHWPQALQALTTIAARHHFTSPQALSFSPTPTSEAPQHHVIFLNDPWGGNISIMVEVNTVIQVYSPCLLHDSANGSTTTSL